MKNVTLEQALSGHYDWDTETTKFSDGSEVVEAWYVQMPGCVAQAGTEPEAVQKLKEMRDAYIRHLHSSGADLPEPDMVKVTSDPTETFSASTGAQRWVTPSAEKQDASYDVDSAEEIVA